MDLNKLLIINQLESGDPELRNLAINNIKKSIVESSNNKNQYIQQKIMKLRKLYIEILYKSGDINGYIEETGTYITLGMKYDENIIDLVAISKKLISILIEDEIKEYERALILIDVLLMYLKPK